MVAAVKDEKKAALVYDSLSPDDQAAVHALIDKGTPKLHALNLVRSQRAQDTARTAVEADDETRDPTRTEQLGAAGMGAADAATFGLADEIRGALNIVPGVAQGMNAKDAYEEGRDDARAYSQGKLGAAFGAGQLAGTAAQAGAGIGAGAAGVASGLRGSALSQSARLGAVTGGLGGFGGGDGATSSLKGAGTGAALGAALGILGSHGGAVEEAPEEVAASEGGDPTSFRDTAANVVDKIRSIPGPVKAVARHVPFVGKAINIADSLAELGLVPKATPAAAVVEEAPAGVEAKGGGVPELSNTDLDAMLAKIGHPSSAPVAAADELPPSMLARPATPATPSADWHVTPEQLAAGDVPPEAEADLARLANVSGKATTPLPKTGQRAASGYNPDGAGLGPLRTPELAKMGGDVEAKPAPADIRAALEQIESEGPAMLDTDIAASKARVPEAMGNDVIEGDMSARQANAIARSQARAAAAPKSGAEQLAAVKQLLDLEPNLAKKPDLVAKRLGIKGGKAAAQRLVNNALFGF